jgi:hypothetical protein
MELRIVRIGIRSASMSWGILARRNRGSYRIRKPCMYHVKPFDGRCPSHSPLGDRAGSPDPSASDLIGITMVGSTCLRCEGCMNLQYLQIAANICPGIVPVFNSSAPPHSSPPLRLLISPPHRLTASPPHRLTTSAPHPLCASAPLRAADCSCRTLHIYGYRAEGCTSPRPGISPI